MASWYSLNGAFLHIDSEDAALEKPLLIYLEELRTAPRGSAPDFQFIIERGAPHKPPAEAQLLYERARPDAPNCQYWADGNRKWFIIPDRLSLEYSTTDCIARMCAAPGHEWLIGGTAAIHALYAALHATGQALVHAAALRLPRNDAALVLFAPSGAGKTTTSLALALQGFGLMTDDATVLADSGQSAVQTHVWGLPRPPKVHRRTAELLPEIGRELGPKWNADGEQALPHQALKALVDTRPGWAYPVAGLVLLGERVPGQHVLRPMPKSDLFVHFANDNLSRSSRGPMDDDITRYQRLVRMVASTPAYQLNVGSDLSTLGETITAVLGGADQAILSA